MHDGQWGVPGYSEIRELGAGASGRVMLARRDHDGGEVAIKYLADQLRSDVGFVARFRHEARLLGTMRSPYNAQLIDYVESGEGSAIVMELVNGVSLREILRSEGPTGPEAALAVLKGSLKGLAAAHAIGVVHRDFKPENVIVQGDGTSKLVDFGIAVRAGQGASAAGTPPYMAPEQWSGSPSAPATDVYAATVVFFECLTGTRPYRAANVAALARQHHSTPPPVEEVPAPLQSLVERGLAKHPSERPPTAEAFLTELEAVAAEAYGADWEERGRRRLARLAGLLLLLFPTAPDTPAEVQTSLTETTFGGPSRLLAKLSAKIVVGTVSIGAVVAVAIVLVNSVSHKAQLQAQTTQATPSIAAPATDAAAPTDEPSSEAPPTPTPSDTRSDTPTPDPTTSSAAPPPLPTKTATPTPSPAKATKTPKPKPTKTPTKKPTPSDTPDPEVSGKIATADPGTPNAPTPTPTPTLTQPTGRPSTSSPPPSTTEPSTPSGESPPPGRETPSETPSPNAENVPAGLLALGLVTSGAVPVTLAVKRRMAGRHRRKR
ncbi:serine/threonine-protein kinase [Nonomuraea sediminis]|uniref:serine/threonine-protein kinase n=1 Tax=Nonomuraea sediminis TaxID=2835864 RepID=UPI002029D8E5|nr:serine/threonine-protein kinase [Nonomuraea sediminis]